MELPEAFARRMRQLLGGEAAAFFAAYDGQPLRGLRVNPHKWSGQAQDALPFALRPAPFSRLSYYVPTAFKAGRHPLHHAGAFYMQEPSAAAPVTALDPQPGERVLDLCAAPGGKSTQIAALLQGRGLLWSNEVVASRAQVLLSNMERMGVANAVVSNCRPDQLCTALQGFFDRVLVDAPCSGEGMFRREPRALAEWSPAHVQACAARQLAILHSAQLALRPGGVLCYSTCTFSEEENEGVVRAFLAQNPAFTLLPADVGKAHPGMSMDQARRIYPMDGGEGQFVALLRKADDGQARVQPAPPPKRSEAALQLAQSMYRALPQGTPAQVGDRLYLLPLALPSMRGLSVLRAGLFLGQALSTRRGASRLQPAHAAFMAAAPAQLSQCLRLSMQDPRVEAFLRGEEIPAPPDCKGWCGVSVEGAVCGFGKCSAGRLKNHYPKGLRLLSL